MNDLSGQNMQLNDWLVLISLFPIQSLKKNRYSTLMLIQMHDFIVVIEFSDVSQSVGLLQ